MGLIVATGLYGAGREVESAAALVDTSYGRTLLVKAALLLAAGGLGLVNSARLHGRAPGGVPRWLARRPGAPASAGAAPGPPRLLGSEAAVGVVLLLMAGLLVETPPPRVPAAGADAAPTAVTRAGAADDVVVSVTVTPNRPGTNGFTVLAASSRRPAMAPIDGVDLQVAGADPVPLQQIQPGRYFGTAALAGPGPARITILIRRGGQRLPVPVEWSVPPAIAPPVAQAQPEHLAPLGNLLAAVVIAGLAAIGLRRWRSARRRRALPLATTDVRVPEEVR